MFNLKFDFVFRSVNDRLRHYDSASACGQRYAILIEDFRSDSKFIRTVDELFREVVAQYTSGECIVSDGVSLETVVIDLGTSLDLYFRLYFLDAPNGYGIAPAKFSVASDTTRENCMLATLCCGMREPDGNFWYPTTRRMPNVVMPDDNDWAYSHTFVYGPPTISSWIGRQTRKRGEE
ncbi:MAG: hypothetical protein KDB03_14535 [Planctomycetales bacterium]|nr:hypothetical protein [Planctomycetales bacterium]